MKLLVGEKKYLKILIEFEISIKEQALNSTLNYIERSKNKDPYYQREVKRLSKKILLLKGIIQKLN